MIYEYALDEQIRICLILEQLFQESDYYTKKKETWDAFQGLRIILVILKVTEARDLKVKLVQYLCNYARQVRQFMQHKQVDKWKLNTILKQLDYFIDACTNDGEVYFGQELRKNDFLSYLKNSLVSQEGVYNLSDALYQSWLQQNESIRGPQLFQWLGCFNKLRGVVELVLRLLRKSVVWHTIKSNQGRYSCPASGGDLKNGPQLLRVSVGDIKNIYPKFERYQRAVTVSFYPLDVAHSSTIIDYDLTFDLAICRI